MEAKEMVCIVCPIGCQLTVTEDKTAEKGYKVEGNKCSRGAVYGVKELTNPTRVVTSTVKIKDGLLPRLPVKTDGDIPKHLINECMKELNAIEVQTPIKVGDVIIKNILDTGIDIIASRSM